MSISVVLELKAAEGNLASRAGPGAMTEMAGLVARPPAIRYFNDVDA